MQVWNRLREELPQKESPYFAIEFTQAVAQIRDDVKIVIFRDANGEIEAILPFQRTSPTHAEPVGGRLNDVHGILGGHIWWLELQIASGWLAGW